jgi:hypothetical protein
MAQPCGSWQLVPDNQPAATSDTKSKKPMACSPRSNSLHDIATQFASLASSVQLHSAATYRRLRRSPPCAFPSAARKAFGSTVRIHLRSARITWVHQCLTMGIVMLMIISDARSLGLGSARHFHPGRSAAEWRRGPGGPGSSRLGAPSTPPSTCSPPSGRVAHPIRERPIRRFAQVSGRGSASRGPKCRASAHRPASSRVGLQASLAPRGPSIGAGAQCACPRRGTRTPTAPRAPTPPSRRGYVDGQLAALPRMPVRSLGGGESTGCCSCAA